MVHTSIFTISAWCVCGNHCSLGLSYLPSPNRTLPCRLSQVKWRIFLSHLAIMKAKRQHKMSKSGRQLHTGFFTLNSGTTQITVLIIALWDCSTKKQNTHVQHNISQLEQQLLVYLYNCLFQGCRRQQRKQKQKIYLYIFVGLDISWAIMAMERNINSTLLSFKTGIWINS